MIGAGFALRRVRQLKDRTGIQRTAVIGAGFATVLTRAVIAGGQLA